MARDSEILSIGHSVQSSDELILKLRAFGVTAVADVRTSPTSSRHPQFNWDELKASLQDSGIAYSFLGKELGGRPKDPGLYTHGVADYEKMARTPLFGEGISRVLLGAETFRVALLCSEYHPADCHRCLLVGRTLEEFGIDTLHIVGPEQALRQTEVEEELLRTYKLSAADMFLSREQQLASAYRSRAERVAYAREEVRESRRQNG